MKVLVMCEESQAVCKAFRERGHEAYSVDLQPCSGGHPEWHFQGDCFLAFKLVKPDLVVAHPPCTYFSRAGACHLFHKGKLDEERYKKGLAAKDFFLKFFDLPVKYLAVENPVPMGIYELPNASQVIQPYEFGDPYTKKTYLWLKNLPPLIPTDILCGKIRPWVNSNYKGGYGVASDAKKRSKTFPGIARAMAEQWGNIDGN